MADSENTRTVPSGTTAPPTLCRPGVELIPSGDEHPPLARGDIDCRRRNTPPMRGSGFAYADLSPDRSASPGAGQAASRWLSEVVS